MSDFLPGAVELVRRLSRDQRNHPKRHVVHLAAHLFAVASKIPTIESARLDDPAFQCRGPDTVAGMLDHLAELPADTPAPALFQALGRALVLVEKDLAADPADRTALPDSTGLQDHPGCGLAGEVVHWLRPRSALSDERDRRRRLLLEEAEAAEAAGEEAPNVPPAPAPRVSDYLCRLAMFWNQPQGPRLSPPPKFELPSALLEDSGRDAVEQGHFRIALCPLAGPWHPLFRIPPEGRYFRALGPESFEGGEDLHRHLGTLVEAAAAEEVHLLVLPELTVDQAARRHLVASLGKLRDRGLESPYGVVAGSFHVWSSGQDPVHDAPANEARLLDARGGSLLVHQKRGKFRLTRKQVQAAARFFPERPEPLPAGVSEVVEDVTHRLPLQVLDTPLGRLALAICADCIAPDDTELVPVFKTLRPDLLLIVSMTPKTEKFERFLDLMGEAGIGCLFVNARCVCPPKGKTVLAAADLGLPEPAGAAPTRVRWRLGRDEAELLYFRPPDQAPGETGVSWLSHGGHQLGLVVDLGVHLRKR